MIDDLFGDGFEFMRETRSAKKTREEEKPKRQKREKLRREPEEEPPPDEFETSDPDVEGPVLSNDLYDDWDEYHHEDEVAEVEEVEQTDLEDEFEIEERERSRDELDFSDDTRWRRMHREGGLFGDV